MKQSQSFKKLFFTFMFFFISSEKITACCCCSALTTITHGVGLGGYWELTDKYYPKTVACFEKLREKYPVLLNIPIIIWNGPCADTDTIYFSIKWIEKLEKGNKFYLDATEWIILHEAGHIHHNDILKMTFSNIGFYISFLITCTLNQYELSCENTKKFALAAATTLSAGCLMALGYMIFTREYAADDFAMEYCDNPQAWLAAYEFLDRFAPLGILPGILHSFTTYRLERISKAFQEKFEYELVVVPQSLHPEYLTEQSHNSLK